jgi:hypothetical protein
VKRTLIPPFRSGPWTGSLPPTEAREIDGVPIVERLITREDATGALVLLANGRLAVLGDVLVVAHPLLLRMFATRRSATADNEADRIWWHEVRDAVSAATPPVLLHAARS